MLSTTDPLWYKELFNRNSGKLVESTDLPHQYKSVQIEATAKCYFVNNNTHRAPTGRHASTFHLIAFSSLKQLSRALPSRKFTLHTVLRRKKQKNWNKFIRAHHPLFQKSLSRWLTGWLTDWLIRHCIHGLAQSRHEFRQGRIRTSRLLAGWLEQEMPSRKEVPQPLSGTCSEFWCRRVANSCILMRKMDRVRRNPNKLGHFSTLLETDRSYRFSTNYC